jgi:hypothetical protein
VIRAFESGGHRGHQLLPVLFCRYGADAPIAQIDLLRDPRETLQDSETLQDFVVVVVVVVI